MQVFIMGTGRSGTSIFNKIIGEHESIWSFRWETQIFSGLPALVELIDTKNPSFLCDRFAERCQIHLYRREVGGRYDAGLFEIIEKDHLALQLDQLRDMIRRSGSRSERINACIAFSDSIFSKAALAQDKQVWCEKTPRNLLYADQIQQLYPAARFINVIRDGREVAASILERKFWPIAKSKRFPSTLTFGGEITLEKAVQYWVTLMDITEEMRGRVGQENWLDVRLEDLGGNLSTIQIIFERFLNVARDEQFQDKASALVRPDRADKKRWKNSRSIKELSYMEKEMEEVLNRYGYTA